MRLAASAQGKSGSGLLNVRIAFLNITSNQGSTQLRPHRGINDGSFQPARSINYAQIKAGNANTDQVAEDLHQTDAGALVKLGEITLLNDGHDGTLLDGTGLLETEVT